MRSDYSFILCLSVSYLMIYSKYIGLCSEEEEKFVAEDFYG